MINVSMSKFVWLETMAVYSKYLRINFNSNSVKILYIRNIKLVT